MGEDSPIKSRTSRHKEGMMRGGEAVTRETVILLAIGRWDVV